MSNFSRLAKLQENGLMQEYQEENIYISKKHSNPSLIPLHTYILNCALGPSYHISRNQEEEIPRYYRVFIKYCVFFEDFKIYSGFWPFSVFPLVSVCVHRTSRFDRQMAGRTPAQQYQNWQSSEKNILRKITQ